jgi:hypothetical protein
MKEPIMNIGLKIVFASCLGLAALSFGTPPAKAMPKLDPAVAEQAEAAQNIETISSHRHRGRHHAYRGHHNRHWGYYGYRRPRHWGYYRPWHHTYGWVPSYRYYW